MHNYSISELKENETGFRGGAVVMKTRESYRRGGGLVKKKGKSGAREAMEHVSSHKTLAEGNKANGTHFPDHL